MLLHGEQPITVTLNGQTYGDKTVDLDTQNEAIWGSQPQLQVKDSSGVTYTYDNGFLTCSETGSAEVTMAEGVTTTDHQIQIAENANVTLTLRDVAINAGDKNRPAILVSNGGNLTLVLTGSSTMEASVRHGAVLAASEAALTIQGTGSLTVKNSAQSADRFSYNVGIWAKTLAIEGNPTLTAEINSDGIGLRGTTIGIHGGRIEAKSGNYGAAGIGGAYNAPSTVTITGGTVYAEGGRLYSEGGALSNPYTQAVITGGSVNMNRLHNSSRNDFKQPKNTSDALLYCATLTIGSGSTLSKNAQVLGLTIKRGGSNYTYGMDNMLTDGNGKLYLWLPEGAVVSEVKTVNGTYSGSCTTNTNRTSNDSGNIWGTASAAFTISGAMFYPVEDITLEEISKTGKFNLSSLAAVAPANAANKDIVWSIEGENTANAAIDGQMLTINKIGAFTLKATIADGKGANTDFTKAFSIRITDAVVEPTAANRISYGQSLSQAALSIQGWNWVDGTVIPTVSNSGYPAYISVADDSSTDYTGVDGYNDQDKTVTRTIPVTVEKAAPAVSVQAAPSSAIAGKTVSVTATVKNPNNESLTDVPVATLSYQIGDNSAATTFTESFVIPKDTAAGTIITITAVTAAGGNYQTGKGTVTVAVIACPHTGSKTLQHDDTHHWYLCGECGEKIDEAAHSGGAATCTTKAVCSACSISYGELERHNLTKQDAAAPTCTTAGNVEYWHCSVCNKSFSDAAGTVEITEIMLNALKHDWGDWTSNSNGTHTHTCKRDGSHTETKDCSGGTATCAAPATCAACGQPYGGKDSNHHTGQTEIRNATSSYTGDTYCLGCGVMLKRGTTISTGGGSSSGGSSGSSGGNSGSSGGGSTIADRPDEIKPDIPAASETKPVKPDADGNAAVDHSAVQSAINAAKTETNKNGNTGNRIAVTIPIIPAAGQTSFSVILKPQTLDTLVREKVKQLKIDIDGVIVEGMDADLLKWLDTTSAGGDIIFRVKQVDVPGSSAAKAAIGTRPALE